MGLDRPYYWREQSLAFSGRLVERCLEQDGVFFIAPPLGASGRLRIRLLFAFRPGNCSVPSASEP
jgi:hypothetical protein